MGLRHRFVSLALLASAALLGACSDEKTGSGRGEERQPAISKDEFCRRWAEIGALQSDNPVAAAMELARISLESPEDIEEPVEALYQLLEDRLAGDDVDFDAMADASTEVQNYCA